MLQRPQLKQYVEQLDQECDRLYDATASAAKVAGIHSWKALRWSYSHRPVQIGTCALVGFAALVVPLESKWRPLPTFMSGVVSLAGFVSGSYLSRKWMEESNLSETILEADRLDMADELAVSTEARRVQRRQQYGLPNLNNQIEQMQLLVKEAIVAAGVADGAASGYATAANAAPQSGFPEEDLAEKLARYQGGWVLIVAPTGCGKTNFLNAAIAKANGFYQGNVDFFVAVGKENEKGYLGLERSSQDYCLCEVEDQVKNFEFFHAGVMSLLQREDTSIPVIYVADEWNNILLTAQCYDLKRRKSQKEREFALSVMGGLTRGRTKKHFGWLTTHSPDVTAIGLPEKIKHSCVFMVFGRGSLNGMLYEAVSGKQAIVQDARLRKTLVEQLDSFYQNPNTDKERVVALTNLDGPWRLVFLPRYPDYQPPIERGVLNQSVEEIAEQDDQAEGDRPAEPQPSRPTTTPPIQPKPISPQGQPTMKTMMSPNKLNTLRALDLIYESEITGRELTADELNNLTVFFQGETKQSLRKIYDCLKEHFEAQIEVSELAQIILDKVQEKGVADEWIDATWVKNFAFRSAELNAISPDQIRDIFTELFNAGYGAIAGEGKSLRWRSRP